MTPFFPARETRLRLAAAVVLIPVYVLAAVVGRWLFLAAIVSLTAVGTWELFSMTASKPYRPRRLPGVGLAVAFPVVLYFAHEPVVLAALVVFGIVGVGVAQLLDPSGEETVASVAVTVLGALYVGVLMGHQVLVRELPREMAGAPYLFGVLLLAVPVALTWVNDTAAYFVGHRWGRRKLIPRVSPGKSVEGAVGAAVVTTLAAVGVLALVDRWVRLFELGDAVAIGILISLAAPAGDLLESSFKRDLGSKDSSRLIPGHGGLLDRFDSMLVSVPVFYYWLHWAVL